KSTSRFAVQARHPAFAARQAPHCGDKAAIEAIVVGLEKHRLAPIAALGDVMRQARHNHSRNPGHALTSTSLRPPPADRKRAALSCKLSPVLWFSDGDHPASSTLKRRIVCPKSDTPAREERSLRPDCSQ